MKTNTDKNSYSFFHNNLSQKPLLWVDNIEKFNVAYIS